MSEHEGFKCSICGSNWIRWEHLDGKDCDNCEQPCTKRICNEEDCTGEAITMDDQDSISWGELAKLTHATQVRQFGWCMCEEQEQFPYDDCPKED
jgi:hypothetical protein